MRKGLRILLLLLLTLVLVVGGYVGYVFLSYHRLDDQLELTVERSPDRTLCAGTAYTALSFNIGFGAYEPDYSFFMDGGTESRAWSEERLTQNVTAIADFLSEQAADLYLLQEVDQNSTRTYHVDERAMLTASFPEDAAVWAQNYDSPYLFYPLTQPHGASRSGLLTLSGCRIDSALRRQLPVEDGFRKILDLDRCYSVSRLPVDNGRELVLYNLHLSAYSADGSISTEQLKLLAADMQEECQKGNYCIGGGDFNKDLLGSSEAWFHVSGEECSWAKPFPTEVLDGTALSLIAPLDEDAPVPSCRNADAPYHDAQFVLTVDGFLVSANVTVLSSEVVDTGFAYSDHNPVRMQFQLQP